MPDGISILACVEALGNAMLQGCKGGSAKEGEAGSSRIRVWGAHDWLEPKEG